MHKFIDISVLNFTGHFTTKAKAFGVKTQILLKVPKFKTTTVRLIGDLASLEEFLVSLKNTDENFKQWANHAIQMHLSIAKDYYEDKTQSPHWKNRRLIENQLNTIL